VNGSLRISLRITHSTPTGANCVEEWWCCPSRHKYFDLLDYLIRNRQRVVSKDDLNSAVWNGRIVSDVALTTRLNAARSAIGDTGEKQRLIKTLPRRGFRFVGAVQEDDGRAVKLEPAAHGSEVTPIRISPPRLSIVVLPFANLSGAPEQEYFVDGVTESLTTDLSRIEGAYNGPHQDYPSFTVQSVLVAMRGRRTKGRPRLLPSTKLCRSKRSGIDGSDACHARPASFYHLVGTREQ
jgi:DNA-binding winged helix-turn-helix (wHTH) protein